MGLPRPGSPCQVTAGDLQQSRVRLFPAYNVISSNFLHTTVTTILTLHRKIRLKMLSRALRLSCANTHVSRAKLVKSAVSQFQVRSFASPPSVPAVELKKTPLHDLHVSAGAKMVPFAGYSMPVTYADQGLVDSHNHVRTKAGLFDVSHMVQHRCIILFLKFCTCS